LQHYCTWSRDNAFVAEFGRQQLDIADAVLKRHCEAAGRQDRGGDTRRRPRRIAVNHHERKIYDADLSCVDRGRHAQVDPALRRINMEAVSRNRGDVRPVDIVEGHIRSRASEVPAEHGSHRARADHCNTHLGFPPSSRNLAKIGRLAGCAFAL
jgi:hypothetical protein